jgi:alpha-beta hydrolase superfamily lysophospholipase
MTRIALSLALVLVLVAIPGCQQDFYAQKVLTHDTTPGRVQENLVGTGEQLQKQGRISSHVAVAMPDGASIDAWILKARAAKGGVAPTAKGTVLILHGLAESKGTYPYLGAAQRLSQRGFDVVLLDLRAHGRSGGKYVTYGGREKYDVMAVMDQLCSKGDVSAPIYVFGVTLGGATAIQYAAIDPRVKGVIAVAPYKDARSMMRWQLALLAPTMSSEEFGKVVANAGKLGDFAPEDASCVEAVKKLKCPLVLYHGMLDLSVSLENSQAIYDAAHEPKRLVVVTPGPEQVAMAMVLEDWIADRVSELAAGKLPGAAAPQPATQTAEQPIPLK